MEEIIEQFVKVEPEFENDYGSGFGSVCGDGFGSGKGSGCGWSDGSGYGWGSGDGYGSGNGNGDGYGSGWGSGEGYGEGFSFGPIPVSGDGPVFGDKIATYNGNKVYHIDKVATIIETVHGNVAKGYILNTDLTTTPCFVAKENNLFAHGETLHEAILALQDKLNESLPVEERIKRFHEKFPDIRKKYPAEDLFVWHHVLTRSCMPGRKSFCKDHGIDIEKDYFSVEEFVKLTKDSYGGEIIQKILNT